MNDALQALLASATVWRAREPAPTRPAAATRPAGDGAGAGAGAVPVLPTGWPALDAALPDGGWPLGTLIEVLLPEHGVGELRLLLPVLCRLGGISPADAGADGAAALHATPAEPPARAGWLVWVSPPLAPYPPALAQAGIEPTRLLLIEAPQLQDRLWATEQALRSRGCSAVLAWLDGVDDRWLRRLCLAAAGSRTLMVAFRPLRRRAQASPARLRLALEPHGDTLDVHLLKSRGGPRQVRNALRTA